MKYVISLRGCISSPVQVCNSSYRGEAQSGRDYPYNHWSTLRSAESGPASPGRGVKRSVTLFSHWGLDCVTLLAVPKYRPGEPSHLALCEGELGVSKAPGADLYISVFLRVPGRAEQSCRRGTVLWDFPLLCGCLQPHQVSTKRECSELALFFTTSHQLHNSVLGATLRRTRSPVFRLGFTTVFQEGAGG